MECCGVNSNESNKSSTAVLEINDVFSRKIINYTEQFVVENGVNNRNVRTVVKGLYTIATSFLQCQ